MVAVDKGVVTLLGDLVYIVLRFWESWQRYGVAMCVRPHWHDVRMCVRGDRRTAPSSVSAQYVVHTAMCGDQLSERASSRLLK